MQTSINAFLCFLKKFQEIPVASCNSHLPYTKPFIKIVSDYFKIKPSTGPDCSSEPLILLIQNRTRKHFKNISRKICSSHCFLYRHHISSIENNSITKKLTKFYPTHIYEGHSVTRVVSARRQVLLAGGCNRTPVTEPPS